MTTKIIIFSKNRAIMVDALLRSIYEYAKSKVEVTVIFKATTKEFRDGYFECAFIHQEIYFKKEIDLKRNLLDELSYPQTCFMVDDDIAYSDFIIPILNVPFETHSLRLHSSIKNPLHFDYKISLDGNIFRTEDIIPLIKQIQFINPNELESRLQGGFGSKFQQTHNNGHLIGFNHTRVSDSSGCAFTGIYTDAELNDRYLRGERIDFKAMNIRPTNNVHSSQEYKFHKL